MWHLTLRNLRANLTRLVATAIAVISGTAFVATGLVLTQAVGNAVAGNVALQYDSVDAAVVGRNSEEGPGSGIAGVDASLLPEVRALPEVAGAAGELAESAQLLDANGDALRTQMLGRIWITDDELNPFTVTQGSAPKSEGEIAVDSETADRYSISLGDEFDLATPSGPSSGTVVGLTEFGKSGSLDGGGTVFFSPGQGLDLLDAGAGQFNQILTRTDGSESALLDAARCCDAHQRRRSLRRGLP